MQFTREEVETILRRHVEAEFDVQEERLGDVTFHGVYAKEEGRWFFNEASVDIDTKQTGSPYR